MLDLENAVGSTADEEVEYHTASELASRHKSPIAELSFRIYQVPVLVYLQRAHRVNGADDKTVCDQDFPPSDSINVVRRE